jgi:phosphoglycerol transferase MdoB-like AlkP superfamily enzyme
MLAGLLFTGPAVRLLGANDAIMEPTMEYARVLFFFMIPLIMYVQLVFFVRIDDDPNRVLAATSVCAFVNLVLDTSSAGIRQIIAAHKQMNGALTLRNVTPEVLAVLHMTGLDKKLHIEQ